MTLGLDNDVRYALRTLQHNPGFASVAVVTLALGIGATTAMFSVVNSVLLRPLPYPEPHRVVQVWSSTGEHPRDSHAPADFLDLKERNRTLEALAAFREDAVTIARDDREPIRVTGALVTADFFDVFGMPALIGRAFSPAADAEGGEAAAVISETLWTSEFGRDPSIVGRRVRINTAPHTIVGIMPEAFKYPAGSRVWVLAPKPVPPPPIDVPGELLVSREVHFFQAIGRATRAATTAQVQADLAAVADALAREFPATNGGRTVTVMPLREGMVGDVRQALLILFGAVGIVLFIACANVAGLLLARASGRRREMAVRVALGAGRGRLVRQLLTESLLLASAGGALGLLAGFGIVNYVTRFLPDGGMPRADEIHVDTSVAIASVLITCASALVFCLIPSLQASRADVTGALRAAGDRSSTAGPNRTRTRTALVIGEIALTIVLMVAAGLLANSLIRMQRVDPGFRMNDVTIAMLPLPQRRYVDGERQADVYERVLEGVQQRRGLQAALVFPSPLEGASASGRFSIQGQPETRSRGNQPFAALTAVSADYFRTMGIPLISGRTFTTLDRPPTPAPAILNALLARKYFRGQDPVGKRIRFGASGSEWITIVGVVGDTRNMGISEDPAPILYVPFRHLTVPFMSVVMRGSGSAAAAATAVRESIRNVDPELAVDSVLPMRSVVRESIGVSRFGTLLVSAFALVALALAAVGLYGVVSYSVAPRTREIGIRVALGARPGQVMSQVIREGMTLTVVGVGLGLAGALGVTRLISAYLFGVEATDPLTFSAVAMLLLAVALIASYLPSRRAVRVDPLVALRMD